MREVAALVTLSPLTAGCISNGKITVTPEQLRHHRLVLESVSGEPMTSDESPPEISFGEKMIISGSMCNRFSGEGELSNSELATKGLAITRMMYANPQFNELDNTINEMLKEGTQVDLAANQLTLATAKQTLTYKLADLMNQQLPQFPAASDYSLQHSSLDDTRVPIAVPSS